MIAAARLFAVLTSTSRERSFAQSILGGRDTHVRTGLTSRERARRRLNYEERTVEGEGELIDFVYVSTQGGVASSCIYFTRCAWEAERGFAAPRTVQCAFVADD